MPDHPFADQSDLLLLMLELLDRQFGFRGRVHLNQHLGAIDLGVAHLPQLHVPLRVPFRCGETTRSQRLRQLRVKPVPNCRKSGSRLANPLSKAYLPVIIAPLERRRFPSLCPTQQPVSRASRPQSSR